MARWCILTATVSLACVIPAIALAQYGPPSDSGGVVPAGWKSRPSYGGYAQPYGNPDFGPMPSAAQSVYQEIPETRLIYDESPVERVLANVFRHAYFRVDYLLWDISDPGDTLLGAHIIDEVEPASRVAVINPAGGTTTGTSGLPLTTDTTNPFNFTDVDGGAQVGVVPSLRGVSTNENNGIRATFGLPTFVGGAFEASVFALQTSTAQVPINTFNQALTTPSTGTGTQVTGLRNVLTAIVQPVLFQGNETGLDQAILYEVDYTTDPINGVYRWGAALQTSVWGSDASFVFDAWDPGADIVVRPLFGIRYLNFSEELRQQGNRTLDVTVNDTAATVTAFDKLDSTTINNIYGPQIGLRFEHTRSWLTLGVQPRVLLGVNTYNAKLQQSVKLIPVIDPDTGLPTVDRSLLASQEEYRSLRDRQSTFGLVGDLEAFTRIHFNDHLALYCSYNLLWTGLITRPADNVVYNQSLVDGIPRNDFGLDVDFSGAILQGISIGGEISY